MRWKYSKKHRLLLTIICCAIIVLSYLSGNVSALQEQVTSKNVSPSRQQLLTTSNPSKLDVTSSQSSSILMLNARTGERLLAENSDIERAPASTIKLLTGIVAMEKLHENDVIQVGKEVLNIEGSQMGLLPGDKILVKDLLLALYLESANDAAVALAVAAAGTVEDFSIKMNEYATQIGCTKSQFKTPNGLPFPGQYTTADDLAQIALEFIKRDDLMKYVRMKEANIEWNRSNGLRQKMLVKNTNQLLGVYPGDTGLKTGTTTEAGQCLVSYTSRLDGDILLVLLGSKQRYVDTIELLDQGAAKIRSRSALKNITSHPDSLITAPGFFVR